MYKGLQHLHSLNRYILLALLLIVLVSSLQKWLGKKDYTKLDNRLNLFTFISSHIQLLIGLLLYFLNEGGLVNFSAPFASKIYRFFTIEHLAAMIIAIALITVGRINVKKTTDSIKKHKRTFIYYLVALIIILASIPWPFRNVGIDKWF